jgi:integrase
MSARHEILGGKVQLYKRGRVWHCSTSIGGVQHRETTKKEELPQAEDAAEDWYLELRGKFKRGDLGTLIEANAEKTFGQAAEEFLREFPIVTAGERSQAYIDGIVRRLRVHIIPVLGPKGLSQVNPGVVQDYFVQRIEKFKAETGKPPARNTLHQERVAIRQVLKSAHRHGDLTQMPDLSQPYRKNVKISHRAWFAPAEYKQLYNATRDRIKNPLNNKYRDDYEDLHDYVLFMVNTGLRPDESKRLEFRDVVVVKDRDSGETILEIDVRGKRGVGFCKSMPGAVRPFQRVMQRRSPRPSDRVFSVSHHELFNTLLRELDLKFDRDGQRRTFYSLRHTYICLRLMEGADVYQIAKNCRTSVKMIEDFYASHIKNTVDASIINVRRARSGADERRLPKGQHRKTRSINKYRLNA